MFKLKIQRVFKNGQVTFYFSSFFLAKYREKINQAMLMIEVFLLL